MKSRYLESIRFGLGLLLVGIGAALAIFGIAIIGDANRHIALPLVDYRALPHEL